ncbi:hypothetical protein [Streptomyces antimicrobicus]|uniref:Integral membrane protein n=1 Tax=Streptomyces antimicrobicus TaxID=2883108 RepID=A0ABS8B734_9ACTN|nr:hypothetical protein [Streptomyces antimicrobicus]MCB5180369.1 hypothetical protein [Streptomyces antimicrobicus]
MHGPGLPQHPAPSNNGVQVTLRVVFTALTLLTCGFFAWASLLKLAIVTRSRRNWLLFAVTVAINITCIALLGNDDTPDGETSRGTDIAMTTSLITAIAVVAYFLYEDIRHYNSHPAGWYGRQPAGPYYPPVPPQQQQPAYGYPHAHTPATPLPPVPQQPATPVPPVPQQPATPVPPVPPVQQPTPPPVPQQPRIGQVRAELDELSELLRRQERDQ